MTALEGPSALERRVLQAQCWPGGAPIAVMVTVMLEAWSPDVAPPYSPMASPLRDGVVDLQGIAWASYGGRTGALRLASLVEDAGIRATFAINGRAVEQFPEAVAALAAAGHEIAGHGYVQDGLMPYLAPAEERALIEQCRRLIGDVTGRPPVGWASPRMTPSQVTAQLLGEMGFLWHGDYHDADLPYVIATPSGPLTAIMHSDFTDNRVLRGAPRDFFEVYRDTFDYLHEAGGLQAINLTVHAHFGGRPMMRAMIRKALRHMQQSGSVWFPRHDEMAEFVLAHARA